MSLFSKIWKYIWPQMRKYKGIFFTVFFLFTIRFILDGIIKPFLLKRIVDTLSLSGADHSAFLDQLFYLVYIIIFLIFVATVVARTSKFMYFTFLINVTRELRNFCFQKIQSNSQTFFANTFAGSLVAKSKRFVVAFEVMSDVMLFNFWSTTVVLIGILIVLARESPILAVIFFVWVLIYLSIILLFLRKKVNYDVIESASDSRISARLSDVFGNILAVKIFSSRKSEIKSFAEITEDGAQKTRTAWFLGGKIEVFQAVLGFVVQSVLLYVMVKLWSEYKISTGTVVLVQTYMINIFDRLWDLSNSLTRFMKSAADMSEMIDIFEVKSDILDPEKPERLLMDKGKIQFDNISFVYNNGKEVFENFNLSIGVGERIGLVGHSGAGKSTIISLILRFMDISNGSIKIDGQDIRNITQDDLRSVISYVPQESVLFHRPILENIAYGKPNAEKEEIIEAAKKAHADEFISKLKNGYDTLVGERGVKLSGGERQRVAIARAMLKDSPILILDEATSSLDSISESYIQDAFNELMKGKTAIVIAHRLSTVQKMDRIIVLDKGQIVEEGTHKELLKKNGLYADLWNHQTGGFLG